MTKKRQLQLESFDRDIFRRFADHCKKRKIAQVTVLNNLMRYCSRCDPRRFVCYIPYSWNRDGKKLKYNFVDAVYLAHFKKWCKAYKITLTAAMEQLILMWMERTECTLRRSENDSTNDKVKGIILRKELRKSENVLTN